jgi:hypothetical protein
LWWLKNASKDEQNVSSLLSFEIKDGTGQKYTETILSYLTPPDGKIEVGGLLKGRCHTRRLQVSMISHFLFRQT